MVLVHVEIAFGVQGEIERAVAGEKFEHMVEESDAGGDIVGAGAIDVEGGGDVCFGGGARDFRFPIFDFRFSISAEALVLWFQLHISSNNEMNLDTWSGGPAGTRGALGISWGGAGVKERGLGASS